MEDAVLAEGAYGERLGVILEGVGWWLDAFVADLERMVLLEQFEVDVGAGAVDAARSYVAGDAQMAHVCFVAHGLKLADGDVVALVVANTGEGKIAHGGHDDDCGNDDLRGALLVVRHGFCM